MTKSCLNREVHNGLMLVIKGFVLFVLYMWPMGISLYMMFTLPEAVTREQVISNMNTSFMYMGISGVSTFLWDIIIGMPIHKCYFDGDW